MGVGLLGGGLKGDGSGSAEEEMYSGGLLERGRWCWWSVDEELGALVPGSARYIKGT